MVDQAGAAQPRGDEGDAPTRAVFRLVQVTISHDRIVDREARRLQRLARLRFHGRSRTPRSEEHTSELQSLMRISYAVFCSQNKNNKHDNSHNNITSYPK